MKGMIVLTEITTYNQAGYMEAPKCERRETTIFINPLLYEFIGCKDGAAFIRYDPSSDDVIRKCKENLKEIATKIQESQI
jgi:hypothetical protein